MIGVETGTVRVEVHGRTLHVLPPSMAEQVRATVDVIGEVEAVPSVIPATIDETDPEATIATILAALAVCGVPLDRAVPLGWAPEPVPPDAVF